MPRKPKTPAKQQPEADEPDAFKLDLAEETIEPDENDPPMEHLDRKRDTPSR